MIRVHFIIPPKVELLDLAGPMQVFSEAQFYGLAIEMGFYHLGKTVSSSAGLPLGDLHDYRKAEPKKGDFVIIPGMQFERLETLLMQETAFFNWLEACSKKGVILCSICNAAFLLGAARLLDQRVCTTHWRRVEALRKKYPKTTVVDDVLFVKSDAIYTSAGISAGIDLALSIIEEIDSPFLANKVARGLVVYHRRNAAHSQQSVYLDYRNHINPKIHEVQDYLVANMSTKIKLTQLASRFHMSTRNLSRVFKKATGTTVNRYLTELRHEKARTLKNNPSYTLEKIASECGFNSARQLQRILHLKK